MTKELFFPSFPNTQFGRYHDIEVVFDACMYLKLLGYPQIWY